MYKFILVAAVATSFAFTPAAWADDKAPAKPPTTTKLDSVAQSRSDLGQQLQLALQEANNIYTRSSKAQSDISAKYSQFHDGVAQNFK